MPKRKGDESEASREMRQKRNKRERGRTEKLKKLYLELREELGDKNLERKTNKIRTLDAALGFVCQHEGKVEGRSIEPISMLPTPPPHPPPQVYTYLAPPVASALFYVAVSLCRSLHLRVSRKGQLLVRICFVPKNTPSVGRTRRIISTAWACKVSKVLRIIIILLSPS